MDVIEEIHSTESTRKDQLTINKGGKKILEEIDHSIMNYIEVRKNLYVEVPDVAKMTEAQAITYRAQLDDIKIRVSIFAHTIAFHELKQDTK